jgi:hypothetical protein
MAKRTLRVDDEVFRELQRHAEPLVDDANSVLRRILGLDSSTGGAATGVHADEGLRELPSQSMLRRIADLAEQQPAAAGATASRQLARSRGTPAKGSQSRSSRRETRPRAPHGVLLPESRYELPLLQALVEAGGRAPTSEIIERVGHRLQDQLTELDHDMLQSGTPRWKNRVQFARLSLIKQGFLRDDSSRGVWEITESGRKRALEAEGGSRDQ